MMIDRDFILSTASSLEGYRIIKQCGIVFGETVFDHGLSDVISAKISNFVDSFIPGGNEMSGSVRLIEKAREFAYKKMISDAKNRGANAIIAIESDNTIGGNIMYISLYGTAVKVISESEYEKYIETEKKKQEIAQIEQEERKAQIAQRLKEINELKENGQVTPELLFLDDISSEESIAAIEQLWDKYELNSVYPDIDKTIKKKSKSEKSYGRSTKETRIFIEQLNQILGK